MGRVGVPVTRQGEIMSAFVWTSLFTIIVVAIAIWALYYVIRAAVRAGTIDAYKQMGLVHTPETKEDQLQRTREALQEERVQAVVNAQSKKN